MGYCYSKQQTQTLRSTFKAVRPQKCILCESPPSLIIQMSNGSIQNIPIKTSLQNDLKMITYVEPGIFFGTENEIYLIVQTQKIDDNRLSQAAHTYYINSMSKQTNLIQPECAYLIRSQNKILFIIKSKPLGNEGIKFVDLVQLGKRMKQKQINWQDLQFNQIITQVSRKFSKLDRKQHGINNVIIGSDGTIHLLGFFIDESMSNQQNIDSLKALLLKSLFGIENIRKESIAQLQKKSYFNHNNCLVRIQDLKGTIRRQKQNKYSPITNPGLKFIRDYITAYFYKFHIYNQKIVDTLITLRQPDYAKKIINDYIQVSHINQSITQEWFKILKKNLQIEELYESNSSQTIQAKNNLCQAGHFLAQKFKSNNQYKKSYRYYKQCLQNRYEKLNLNFYVGFYQVCKALNKNLQAQDVILTGLKQHPKGKILHLYLIIHLCDCMKVQQAEKQLIKSTTYFRTLQMEMSTSKILLTRAIMNPNKKIEFIRKSKQQLSKVVLQKYAKETGQNNTEIIPIYHEIKGDAHLQELNFENAQEQYHISKLLLKNQKACGFKLANVTAAQANCLMLKGAYDNAITVYQQALSYINNQCLNLMDSIIGNRAISKIRKGLQQQGIKQIQQILNRTPKQVLQKDYNYIFLQKILRNYQNPKI